MQLIVKNKEKFEMIRHIVFWNLKDFAENSDKNTNANIIKTRLEALVGQIDGLIRADVNLNYNPKGYDLCFFSLFESDEALQNYQKHTLHLQVKEFVHKVITDRVVTDCEID